MHLEEGGQESAAGCRLRMYGAPKDTVPCIHTCGSHRCAPHRADSLPEAPWPAIDVPLCHRKMVWLQSSPNLGPRSAAPAD